MNTTSNTLLALLAPQGDDQAQLNLGVAYALGDGVPQDDKLAAEFTKKAADQGYADAECNLAIMIEQGRGGLPQDAALAVEWYRKAASQGHAVAQGNLGVAYQCGKGVPQSDVEAVKWFRKSAEQGNVRFSATAYVFTPPLKLSPSFSHGAPFLSPNRHPLKTFSEECTVKAREACVDLISLQ